MLKLKLARPLRRIDLPGSVQLQPVVLTRVGSRITAFIELIRILYVEQLLQISESAFVRPFKRPALRIKNSGSCSISSMLFHKLERNGFRGADVLHPRVERGNYRGLELREVPALLGRDELGPCLCGGFLGGGLLGGLRDSIAESAFGDLPCTLEIDRRLE